MRPEEGGEIRTCETTDTESQGAGKWPKINGKAPRDPEIVCRGDNNPQRGTGKQTRKKR